MKLKEMFIVLMIVPLLGCSQPSGSTLQPAAPSVQSPSNGTWTLTEVVTGTSGVSRCPNFPTVVPSSFTQAMSVERSATALTVFVGTERPDEQRVYDGTASGDVFTITPYGGSYSPGSVQCAGPLRKQSDTISGSFSTDGKHLTAHEVVIDHWPDADVVTTLDWTADHQ